MMKAVDIMTRRVVSVAPEASDPAAIMLLSDYLRDIELVGPGAKRASQHR